MRAAHQAAGFDLTLVEESLRLSPEQRLLQHQAALELVLAMERAGRQSRERQSFAAAAGFFHLISQLAKLRDVAVYV